MPVILFIPVSSTEGVGEYNRSLILADTFKSDIPTAQIHFILNKSVSYIEQCPYKVHLSKYSPTKDTDTVKQVLKEIKPDLVIFDCSGRASQYAAAKAIGAKVIFISQHRRKRARGIKLRRLISIDRHWVVQPSYTISPLSPMEKLKIALLAKPFPENIGPLLPRVGSLSKEEILNKLDIKNRKFFLFSTGSGGHLLGNELVADIFYQAAKAFTDKTGVLSVVVFGSNYPNAIPLSENTINLRSLSSDEFITLVSVASGRVLGAGDTLLQAISLAKPSVAAVISKDQPQRLEAARRRNLVLFSETTEIGLTLAAEALNKAEFFDPIQSSLRTPAFSNGREVAVSQMKQILGIKSPTKRRYLFYISQDYSFEILRPIQQVILDRGDECAWFVEGKEVTLSNFICEEVRLNSLQQAIDYNSHAVFVPGNHVPSFIPGVKVSVFHGLEWKKKGHFRIRGFFDLYCTHGELTTDRFHELKSKHRYFEVRETGWPKLDPLYQTKPIEIETDLPVILFAPTFSPNLTCALECLEEIKRLVNKKEHFWIAKFHPKMNPDWIRFYRDIGSDNFRIIETPNCLPLLQRADVILSDTSSIIGEFLLLNKPAVTYKNSQPDDYLIDIQDSSQLEDALKKAINSPSELLDRIADENNKLHPYRDGLSSQRVLEAVEPLIIKSLTRKIAKPLNLIRSFKLRKAFGYWGF